MKAVALFYLLTIKLIKENYWDFLEKKIKKKRKKKNEENEMLKLLSEAR